MRPIKKGIEVSSTMQPLQGDHRQGILTNLVQGNAEVELMQASQLLQMFHIRAQSSSHDLLTLRLGTCSLENSQVSPSVSTVSEGYSLSSKTEDPRTHRMGCSFCKKNGEQTHFYQSHVLKEDGKVVCPILRRHVCPFCSATGDNAHTNKYCPTLKRLEMHNNTVSISEVKKQYRNASGKKRCH
ncbi:uncharacterized protein LOC136035361 [Artemia franciscana]|uniref:Nanos-type domain-containing protein n=1 Tax=Artemia franciscana TaxID=6661 RepID=A0AA88I1Y8_ARTSF|nr:hypothetical protein QYM36_003654 [Artemia franciscana]